MLVLFASIEFLLVFATVAASVPAPVGGSGRVLDLPPRYMWGWAPPAPASASGYCGSVSVQTAGIYYGNWLTEDYVRGTSGGHDAKHSLLLGVSGNNSVLHACGKLKLNCTGWNDNDRPTPQHAAFLQWSKDAIDKGWPVIIGVFWKIDSDPDYDHIVPMVGYDATGIYMNDLSQNVTLRYEESEFVQSRKKCRGKKSVEWCLPKSVDYGVAVHGNADAENVLVPIRMSVSSWTEPDYSKEDRVLEQPTLLTADLAITGLHMGSSYALLQYDHPDDVPDRDFLASSFKLKTTFKASGPTYKYSASFMSNSTKLFRCVQVAASVVSV